MDLMDYRQIMDDIDDQLVALFRQRMETVREIAAYKKEHGLPVLDALRERAKVKELCDRVPEDMQSYTGVLYASLFELSRSYQNRQMERYTDLSQTIVGAVENTPRLFPQSASVALYGGEGPFSQLACEKLFRMPCTIEFNNAEAVFTAVKNGLCDYGVVPLDNGTSGITASIYDLLVAHHFYIVRTVRLKADYCLFAGTSMQDDAISELFAYEGAINQCSEFIKKLGNHVKITLCENADAAARKAAEGNHMGSVALCPRNYGEIYGLKCLKYGIQDRENTFARFLCISKSMEVYPGADRTSILLSLPNRPGALYKLLAQFYALGINIAKLESKPIPEKEHEIAFYVELDASVYAPEFRQIICELSAGNEDFTYLGSYSEVIT